MRLVASAASILEEPSLENILKSHVRFILPWRNQKTVRLLEEPESKILDSASIQGCLSSKVVLKGPCHLIKTFDLSKILAH